VNYLALNKVPPHGTLHYHAMLKGQFRTIREDAEGKRVVGGYTNQPISTINQHEGSIAGAWRNVKPLTNPLTTPPLPRYRRDGVVYGVCCRW
jgi:hypothetical protein